MAKLTKAQRLQKKLERLEQTKLILQSKIEVLQGALTQTDQAMAELRLLIQP